MKEKEAVLWEQCLLGARAVQVKDKEWRIDFSVLGGSTHSWTFYDELEAKAAYKVLENFYLKALKKKQRAEKHCYYC